MSFRTLVILLTILSTLGRIIAEFIVIGWGNQANLPIIIHIFSIALIIYAIMILIYDELKRLTPLPFVILFLSESIVFTINLFLLHDQDGKWYMYHMPFFEQVIIGNYLSVLVNVIVITYYFAVVRRRYW